MVAEDTTQGQGYIHLKQCNQGRGGGYSHRVKFSLKVWFHSYPEDHASYVTLSILMRTKSHDENIFLSYLEC